MLIFTSMSSAIFLILLILAIIQLIQIQMIQITVNNLFHCINKVQVHSKGIMIKRTVNIACPPTSPQINLQDLLQQNVIYEGQYCDVYKITRNAKEYAVKAIDTSRINQAEYQQQFNRICTQIRTLYTIKHYGIIQLLGHFHKGDIVGLIFPLFGRPISEFIIQTKKKQNKNRLFTVNNFIKIFRSIGSAIAQIHAMGFIHRDICQDNILIDDDLNTKIIDFGCVGNIQYSKGMFGTREYLAPQILDRRSYNHKVDVWSFAILSYQLLYGMYLFKPKGKGLSDQEISQQYVINMKQPIQDPPDEKLMLDQKPQPEMITLIKSMLQYNPDKRPQIGYLLSKRIFGAQQRQALTYNIQQYVRQKTYSRTNKVQKSLNSSTKQMSIRQLQQTLLNIIQINSQQMSRQKQLLLSLAKEEKNLSKIKYTNRNI